MSRIKAGDKMPNLTLNTDLRDEVHLYDLLKGKTVFWVLRYIGCPTCRLDVALISARYREFLDKNAQVYVVMMSDQFHIRRDLEGVDIPFEFICDPGRTFYNTLGIEPAESKEARWGEHPELIRAKGARAREMGFVHGDFEGDEQQLPAMFIVEEDGTASYVHYAKTGMDMPEIDEVLNML